MSIRYETKNIHHNAAEERARRVEKYAAQLRGSHLVKRKKLCFAGVMARPVQCLETGMVFPSTSLAAKAMNLKVASVRAAIRSGGRTKKMHFRYVPGSRPVLLPSVRNRAVVCLTTGERFDSISAAARAHAVPISSMFDAVKVGRPCRGHTYSYVLNSQAA